MATEISRIITKHDLERIERLEQELEELLHVSRHLLEHDDATGYTPEPRLGLAEAIARHQEVLDRVQGPAPRLALVEEADDA